MKRCKASAIAAVIVLAVVGCSEGSLDPRAGELDGDVLDEVREWRGENGLFYIPGAENATKQASVRSGDPLVTATVIHVLDEDAGIEAAPTIEGVDDDADLLDVYAATVLADHFDREIPNGVRATLEREAEQMPDGAPAGESIAQVRLFATAWSLAEPDADPPSEVVEAVEELSVEEISEDPYLLYGLREIRENLVMDMPEALDRHWQQVADETPPMPEDHRTLSDAFAVLLAQQDAGAEITLDEELRARLVQISEDEDVDVQMRGIAVATLNMGGTADEYDRALAALQEQRSTEDQLYLPLTDIDGPDGVTSTYQVARLLGPEQFPEVVDETTLTSLQGVAQESDDSPARRLQAAASLARAGENLAEDDLEQLVDVASVSWPDRVGLDDLAGYLTLATPLAMLEANFPAAELQEFNVGDDVMSQRLALTALREHHLFAEGEAVQQMFPDLQHQLPEIALDEEEPFEKRLLSAAALSGGTVIDEDRETLREIDDAISEGQGCRGSEFLYSIDGAADGQCSLRLTVDSLGVTPME